MNEAEYVKTSFKIKKDLFLKAKILASRETTFSEILNRALEEYIREHEKELKEKLAELAKVIQ